MVEGNAARVVFVDENPGVVLLDEAGHPTAAAHLWRSHFSPAGAGHVLAVWRTGAPLLVFTDNEPLAQLVVATFFRHWPVLGEHLDGAVFVPARLAVTIDGGRLLRATATSPEHDALAEWRAWGVPEHHRHQHAGIDHAGQPLTVNAVIVFCDDVRLVINGRTVAGRPEPDPARGRPFVSLAETWSA
jgi:hypothetical protein